MASLDRLVAALGFPATHALLLLAPASAAPAMAAAAVGQMDSSSDTSSGGSAGSSRQQVAAQAGGRVQAAGLQHAERAIPTASQAEAVVRWHRGLREATMPEALVHALAARGLGPAR